MGSPLFWSFVNPYLPEELPMDHPHTGRILMSNTSVRIPVLAMLALLLSVSAGLALPAPPDTVMAQPFILEEQGDQEGLVLLTWNAVEGADGLPDLAADAGRSDHRWGGQPGGAGHARGRPRRVGGHRRSARVHRQGCRRRGRRRHDPGGRSPPCSRQGLASWSPSRGSIPQARVRPCPRRPRRWWPSHTRRRTRSSRTAPFSSVGMRWRKRTATGSGGRCGSSGSSMRRATWKS